MSKIPAIFPSNVWNFSWYFIIFIYLLHDFSRTPLPPTMCRETISLTEDFSASVRSSKMCRNTEHETRNIIFEYKAKGQGQVKFSLGAGDSVKPRYRRCTRNRHRGRGVGKLLITSMLKKGTGFTSHTERCLNTEQCTAWKCITAHGLVKLKTKPAEVSGSLASSN